MEIDEVTSKIIKAAFNVHNALGSGFLEKVYHNALMVDLKSVGLKVISEAPINVYYKDMIVGEYFVDLYVENLVLLELKAVDSILPIHEVQLVNYLNGTGEDIGLLINFGKSVTVKRKFRVNN